VSRSPSPPELLRYLADLGWEEVRRPTQSALGPSENAIPARQLSAAPDGAEQPPPGIRFESLAELTATAETCRRCVLCETRQRVVVGTGDPAAALMFVGEGPGAEEDRQGLPFVGTAGDLLNRILAAMELAREQVYIANVVKCRPPGNRDPLPGEVEACRLYLEGQIDLVRPRVLVALGRVAAQSLLGTDQPVGRLRSRWHEVRGVPLRVTYHPAALLRNASLKRPTWEDMKEVLARLRPQAH
jgi:uracil-DNA glycosylase